MIRYPSSTGGGPILVFGHGAGAGESHPWMRRVGSGLSARGVTVVTFNFPYLEAGRRTPDRGPVLEDAFQTIWIGEVAANRPRVRLFAGGKSMGGRIASQAAAAGKLSGCAGLVFFGYPLHPPGKAAERRDRHLPQVGAPLLFLHGTRDPFGSPDEMTTLTASLPAATLHLVEGGDHSLAAPKSIDRAGASLDRAMDIAAAWILNRCS